MAVAEPVAGGHGDHADALLWSGSQLGLVHVGDSRAYLSGREVFQITHDHTMVQSLLDDGKITEEEVASHPQRSLLMQALSALPDRGFTPDLQLREAALGIGTFFLPTGCMGWCLPPRSGACCYRGGSGSGGGGPDRAGHGWRRAGQHYVHRGGRGCWVGLAGLAASGWWH